MCSMKTESASSVEMEPRLSSVDSPFTWFYSKTTNHYQNMEQIDKEQTDYKNHPLPEQTCEVCGYKFDCAMGTGSQRPRPGDYSVCLKCGEIYTYQPDMTMRVPTLMELMELDAETSRQLELVQTKIREQRLLG